MKNPLISVIIPAYNSEKIIERCIKSLISQSFPREKFEILVVDDGSTDKTAQLAKLAGADTVISIKNQGIWEARKVGVLASKGNFIATIDADCEVIDEWLNTISKELESNSAITGPLLNGNDHSKVAWAEYLMEFSEFHEFKKRSTVEYLTGANHALPKEVYPMEDISNMKEKPEDVIRSDLIKKIGIPLIFVPEMKVKHYGRTDLQGYLMNMTKVGLRVYDNSKRVPTIYSKLTKTKWSLPLVFIIRFVARMRRAIRAKKLRKFILTLPLIIRGTLAFSNGFLKGIEAEYKKLIL